MTATVADFESFGLAKELYWNDVQFQENIRHSHYNHIRKPKAGEVNLDGMSWNIGVQYALNESFGARNDGERIPDPEFVKGLFAKYKPKLNYSSIEMTMFAATRGHKGGRPNGKFIDDNLKSTLLSFMANLDADSIGNGRGYRATVLTATPAAPSFSVEFSTRIRPNMKLDWYDSTYTIKRGSIKISDKGVDRANRTVYIDANFGDGQVPAGATVGDVLVVYGALAAGEPADGRHMGGFARLTDASVAVGALSPSNYAWWMPTNINAGGANPNEMILQQHCDLMNIIAGAYPNKGSINPAWKRAYMAGLLTQRQYTSNAYNTGASSITFTPVQMGKDSSGKRPTQIDWIEDKNMNPTEYEIWIDDCLCLASDYSEEPHLADEDGSEFRFRSHYDSMSGFMRHWVQMVTKQRSGLGRGYGFSGISGVV